MSSDSNSGLSEPLELPWWMRASVFAAIVRNPVFQIQFKRRWGRPKYAHSNDARGALVGVLIGMVLAIWWFLASMFNAPVPASAVVLGVKAIGWPAIIFAVFAGAWILWSCLIETSREFHREISKSGLRNLLAAPVSDAGIFLGLTLPSLFTSVAYAEWVISLLAGLLIVLGISQFAEWRPWLVHRDFSAVQSASDCLLGVLLLIQYLLFLITAVFAGGLYSLRLPPLGALLAAFIHVAVVFIVVQPVAVSLLVGLGISDFWKIPIQHPGILALQALVLFFIAWLTGRVGVAAFARYRRGVTENKRAGASEI
jgi:hypothetical protein